MPTTIEKSSLGIAAESQNTSSVRDQLLDSFKTSVEYRHAFVEEKVQTSIAAQIRAIREQRKMKRPEFAELMGKSPSWVFRLEDPNLPPPTISTLLAVAKAFDTDLEIRFGRFSELLDRLDSMTSDSLEVPSFDDELSGGALNEEPQFAWLKKAEQEAMDSGKLLEFKLPVGSEPPQSIFIPESPESSSSEGGVIPKKPSTSEQTIDEVQALPARS